jgi:hypothetical protein
MTAQRHSVILDNEKKKPKNLRFLSENDSQIIEEYAARPT